MRQRRVDLLLIVLACIGGVTSSNAFGGWKAGLIGARRIVVEHWENGTVERSDTLRPPDEWSRAFNDMILPEESTDGKFLVSTAEYEDSTNTFWILDSPEKSFRELLKTPLFRSSGAVLWACDQTRVVISIGRSFMEQAPIAASVTYLLDADTGAILREWGGLFLSPSSPAYEPRYDRVTGAVWIVKTAFRAGSWQSQDEPRSLIRLDCATGDTTWVSEKWLFGEDLHSYTVPDIFRGHMLVETGDGLTEEEKRGGLVRTLLVDIVNHRVEGEWRWKWGEDIRYGYRLISEDLRGFVHTETDNMASIRWRKLWRTGEPTPVEVQWGGSRGPEQ